MRLDALCRCLLAVVWFSWLVTVTASLAAQDPASRSRVEEGPVVLLSQLDRTVARVADPIQWTLQVEAPAGARVAWPAIGETFGPFELRPTQQRDDIPIINDDESERRRWSRTFAVETIQTGDVTLPPVEVAVRLPSNEGVGDDQTVTLHSEPLTLTVESSLPENADPTKFREIKEVVEVDPPTANASWQQWAIAGVVVCFVGIVVLAIDRWRRRRGRSAAVWAKKELARLQKAPLQDASDATDRFAEVVDVVRRFLAHRYQSEIASQTADEWLVYAEGHELLTEEARKRVGSLFRQYDLHRFAAKPIGREQLDEAFATAANVIRIASDTRAPRGATDGAVHETREA